jgi:ABC-2 type transport system permease protein
MFLLIFRYVFGGAIGASGGLSYVDFLVPGYITTGILFAGMGAAAGMAEDLKQGSSTGCGPCRSPAARCWPAGPWPTPPCWCGACSSPRPSASRSASACTARRPTRWSPSAAVGVRVRLRVAVHHPGAAGRRRPGRPGAGAAGLSPDLRVQRLRPGRDDAGVAVELAEHQPLTVMVDAVRALTQGPAAAALLGHSAGFYVVRALAWSAAILAVFVPWPWPATGEAASGGAHRHGVQQQARVRLGPQAHPVLKAASSVFRT